MTVNSEDSNRNVIPRWRLCATTTLFGELDYRQVRNDELIALGESELEEALRNASSRPGLATLGDLLSVAAAIGDARHIRGLAEKVLSSSEHTRVQALLSQRASIEVSKAGVAEDSHEDQFDAVEKPSPSLRWDSLGWVDYSLSAVVSGRLVRARRAMNVALRLAPSNRHVVRAAARLAIHENDPEKALHVVRRSGGAVADPWLRAAEAACALAADQPIPDVRRTRRMIESGRFSDHALSELRSALATAEWSAGARKSARKLFGASLLKPTENAVAQAAWADRRDAGVAIPDDSREIIQVSPEARAWSSTVLGNWVDSLEACDQWFEDQPFSRRPAIHAGFIAIVPMADYEYALAVTERGLVANPEDFTLVNNRIVALASMGREIATEDLGLLRSLAIESGNRVVLNATLGLVEYRRGNHARGQELYLSAIALADKEGLLRHGALARLFLASEECGHDKEASRLLLQAAKAMVDKGGWKDLLPMHDRVSESLSRA